MAVITNSLLVDIAVAIATGLFLTYMYYTQILFKYWKKRGVPYVEPTSILGNISPVVFNKKSLGEFLKKVYDENPGHPVVGFYALNKPTLMVRDLDVVRSVLVKDATSFLDRSIDTSETTNPLSSRALIALKGQKWRHLRTKLTPTFSSGKIKNMFYLINECGKQLLPCIEQEMMKGIGVSLKDTIARYSTDVISSCAFGVNANALEDPNCEFRAVTRKIFERTRLQQLAFLLGTVAPWLSKLLGLRITDDSVNNYVRTAFWDIVDQRKKTKTVRNDFVDLLMKLKREGEVRADNEQELEEIKKDSTHMNLEHTTHDTAYIKLEDDDFVAQAFIFIGAGYETSSSVITFTLYELAMNTDIQDKLRKNTVEVLDKHSSEVTYEAIAEMTYLDMVVSETMRKYPTVQLLERKCLQDYKIAGTEITIEKETSVVIPILAIHRDPEIYSEPDKFDPERFSTNNKNKRSKFAHLPFGEGPRICIGMRFGQMQVKTALVHILTTYKVKTCADTPPLPLEFDPSTGITQTKRNIVLAFEKIK